MSLESRLTNLWYGHSPLRWLLWPGTLVYRLLLGLDKMIGRWQAAQALPVPVVVVGNITVGGTGKTPTVIWLAECLTRQGLAVGIISRGYGGESGTAQLVTETDAPRAVGDEPLLIRRRTGCPVAVGRDRRTAARLLLEQASPDLLISDDGLQHWRLKGDYEIAVVDGSRGLGNGLCLPAGPLRESATRLGTVDSVLVVGEGAALSIKGARAGSLRITQVYPLHGGEPQDIEAFRGMPVHAVAAIGHPQRFASLLQSHGLVVTLHGLPDHAAIAASDLRFDDQRPVLVTEKDAVKCSSVELENIWVVAVDLQVEDGETWVAELFERVMNHD